MPGVSAILSGAGTESHGSYYTCSAGSNLTVAVHTTSVGGKEVCNYGVLYDASKHCPLWVAYAMDGEHYSSSGVSRTDNYAYDPAISSGLQPNILNGSYGDYTRGHVMAASFRKVTEDAYDQAFFVTNIAPQSSSFNSSTSAWNKIEDKEAELAGSLSSSTTQKLYVVGGPVFRSGYSTTICKTGGMSVAVPTDFYKCYFVVTFDSDGSALSAKGGAYLIPHNNSSSGISNYATSIDQIESLTGFDFFANLPDSVEASAESMTASFF